MFIFIYTNQFLLQYKCVGFFSLSLSVFVFKEIEREGEHLLAETLFISCTTSKNGDAICFTQPFR